MIVKVFQPKLKIKTHKPLTEGEPYCSNCMHHIDNCHCFKLVDVEMSQEEYEKMQAKLCLSVK